MFFLSVSHIFDVVKDIIAASDKRSKPEEVRFIILDFLYVENVDESGLKTLKDIRRYIQSQPHGIHMIITGHEKFKTQFTKFGLIGKVESEDHGEE